ncbi:hypothetical protein [Chitinophaga nivalis]|uniref:Uncharacterized protein n=1 Tax=Chitinophaga nivalis TaxID=2991709 RepID=A0ABT3IP05_9BACT|nr:hypothetical protein [Chitinophaga nivalis]MCW3464855.1 hypothetical protein [Chitinophaga nivalis]MCW3485454.1 hypothetical protein [Chitinophaga nivalis]
MKKKTAPKLKLAKISIAQLNIASQPAAGKQAFLSTIRNCIETWRVC